MGGLPGWRAFFPAEVSQHTGVHFVGFTAQPLTLCESFTEGGVDDGHGIPGITQMRGRVFHVGAGGFHADMGTVHIMAAKPADQRFVPGEGIVKFFTTMPAIRAKNIDIQFSFGDINTDEVEFIFHSETNLANTGYR